MVTRDEPRQNRCLPRRAPDRKRGRVPCRAESSADALSNSRARLPVRSRCRVYLRRASTAGPSPAVVLLHGCNGDWRAARRALGQADRVLGLCHAHRRQSWSARPQDTCDSGSPDDLAVDAYRALNFLVQQPLVDPDRVAVLGFAQGGRLALIVGRTRRSANRLAEQVPRRDRLLSALPWLQGQYDGADADPDRRTRRLGLGRKSAATWSRAATTGGYRGRRTRACRSSSSSIPAPIMPSTRRSSRRRQ